jgi:hypothetical protein
MPKKSRDGLGEFLARLAIGVFAIYGAAEGPYDRFVQSLQEGNFRYLAPALGLLCAAACAMLIALRWKRWLTFRHRLSGSLLLVALAVAALIIAGRVAPSGNDLAAATSNASPVPTQMPAVPTAGLVAMDMPCGEDAPVSRPLPTAEVCVVYWCKGVAYDKAGRPVASRGQIKLRLRVTNNGDHDLDVRIKRPSRILMVVGGNDAGQLWDPPPLTRAAGDRPRQLSISGKNYWALPPNVNNDVSATSAGYYTGFASTWGGDPIPPGGSYLETRRKADGSLVHNGNLVFEVPADHGGLHVVGIALIDPSSGRVLAFQSFDEWGKPSGPQSF